VDQRLRLAVDASVAWYEDIFALHGIGSRLDDGLWVSAGPPPPLHSDAVVVEPVVTLDRVLAALDGREHAGFKDSFASLDATPAGFELLFESSWIHRPAAAAASPFGSAVWSVVTTASELAEWTSHHDTAEVLVPTLLDRGHFKVLSRRVDGEIVAGAVARLGSGTVDVSNVYAVPERNVDWAELAAHVGALFPGRDLVGYERGDDLAAALAGGFEAVGRLHVWAR
jgi:hypothetical protein